MLIREATPTDREVLIALDHVAALEPSRVTFLDRALRSETCLVAENMGRLVGYGVLEYTFYDCGFISLVYVAELERRRGFGRALLEALAACCKTEKLFTSTNQSNTPMQQLLENLCYIPSGVIHNLDPGDPELVYYLENRVSPPV